MLFVIVLFLGHPDYSVRETATIICNHSYFEPYLQQVITQTECTETKNRAYIILSRMDCVRVKDEYENNLELFYVKWLHNNCHSRWINEDKIIKDIQTNSDRFKAVSKAIKAKGIDDPGSWARGHYISFDHAHLENFRKKLKGLPDGP